MATRVTPTEFTNVSFEADEIASLADDLVGRIGLGEVDIEIVVDETTPLGRAEVTGLDPIRIEVESGAFEDDKRPRQFSLQAATDVLGRLLFRVRDHRDDAFGETPEEVDLSLAQHVAWDAYSMGRMERTGHDSQRQRRLYHFRNRHGFTDAADNAFEALWNGADLTWADVDGHSQKALATKP